MGFRYKTYLLITVLFAIILSSYVSAIEVDLANSKDWTDVYSIMLRSTLDDRTSMFVKSESLTALTRILPEELDIVLYDGSDPFIPNLDNQLTQSGYNVLSSAATADYSLSLDPQNGRYLVIAKENFRTASAATSLASHLDAWVLLVDDANVGAIAARLQGAATAIGIGNFKRDILAQIEPLFTERINNNNIFLDSHDMALKFGNFDSVVITDGATLETDMFATKNPVILTGPNKVLEQTVDFLISQDVESTVVVGNELAVVGQQIREQSNKEIKVFIKYGLSDVRDVGRIYALSLFPLPVPNVGLNITDAFYSPETQELVIFFENIGNIGVYELTTLSVKNGETEIASTADPQVRFLGLNEVLPVRYDLPLNAEDISEETEVEFFTSYGASPAELDAFLTPEGTFGPPLRLKLELGNIAQDDSLLTVRGAEYFTSYKRVGVTVSNNGTSSAYYSVKVQNLVVNGLPQDLFKEEVQPILAGEEKTTFLSVELDDIDLQENSVFDITVSYGADQNFLLNTARTQVPFTISKALNMTLVAIIGVLVVVVLGMIMLIVMFIRRR